MRTHASSSAFHALTLALTLGFTLACGESDDTPGESPEPGGALTVDEQLDALRVAMEAYTD
jgi:hypothetical protein